MFLDDIVGPMSIKEAKKKLSGADRFRKTISDIEKKYEPSEQHYNRLKTDPEYREQEFQKWQKEVHGDKNVAEDSWTDGQNAWSSDKHEMVEAGSPAQQAAIAIAMKRAGKKPKQADEAYTPSPAKPFRNPPGFNKQGTGVGNKLAQLNRKEWEEKKKKEQGVAEGSDQTKQVFKDKSGKPVGEIGIDPESSPGNGEWYVYHYATGYSVVGFDSAAEAKRELMYVHKHPEAVDGHPSTKEQGVAEGSGSWIVFDPETKQIKKRFKTHTAGKSYAQTHKLGFASSEYYFDRVKGQEAVAESTNYWTKLQDERNTKLNTLVNELKEITK